MNPRFSLMATTLLLALVALPAAASDSRLAGQIVGEWQCSQQLQPEPGLILNLQYTQLFTAQRHFTLDGNMSMDVGGNALAYAFEGTGNWSTRPNQLLVNTSNSQVTPTSPMARQLHEAGILDVNQLRDRQSNDVFQVVSISRNEMELRHTKENFQTHCVRQ